MRKFGAADIHPLRGPELEETAEGCLSRWVLGVEAAGDPQTLATLAADVSAEVPDVAVDLTRLGPGSVGLDLRLPVSPLEVESFPLVDRVFARLHAVLGIVEINGSPRRHWRTGRNW